jgi:predicted DNA-binding transcriptional regulator YafY
MSETAAAQLRRILLVIPRVADGEAHSIADIAGQARVPFETLLRDLQMLSERLDVPGGFVEGVGIFIDDETVSVTAAHFKRPMRLTMAELSALELGAAVLRAARPAHEHEVLDRVLAKLRKVMTSLAGNVAHEGVTHAELGGAGDPAHLATIRQARRSHRKVRLRYVHGDGSDAGERIVSPYSLFFSSGAWYLAARCETSGGLRFYRADRITSAELTGAPYEVPADFVLEDVLRDGRPLTGEPLLTMRVRYSPRIARWISERERAAPESDGSLLLDHPVHDEEWALRHVLQYGPDAELLSPPALRASLAARLGAMTGAGRVEANGEARC